jgi:Ax21 family sulfation-dependent quorum factor
MKMKFFALAMAAALPLSALATASAQAADLSYTHVEADYINLDHGTDGWGVRGSVNIGESGFYGLGSYSRVNSDNISGDSNTNANELGVGYHHELGDKTDLIGELAYRNADNGSSNIDGARASVGVRSAFAEHMEGFVKANYYDASDYRGDVTGTIGGQYKFTKTWGATAEAELGNGNQAYLLGVRASF